MVSAPIIKTSTKFEAAHRQLGDESKCGYLHGHNWQVEIVMSGLPNDLGYVVDFKDIKDVVRPYDHQTILQSADPLVDVLEAHGQRVCRLAINPTCENMAIILCEDVRAVCRAQSARVSFISITVFENEESSATVSWSDGQ